MIRRLPQTQRACALWMQRVGGWAFRATPAEAAEATSASSQMGKLRPGAEGPALDTQCPRTQPCLPPGRATLSTCVAHSRSRASRKEKTCSSSCRPSCGAIASAAAAPPRLCGGSSPQTEPRAARRASAPLSQSAPSLPRFRLVQPIPARSPHFGPAPCNSF